MTAHLIASKIHNTVKFTTEQYHLIYESGAFSEGDRLELINGELSKMSPIGLKHALCVARLTKRFELKLGDRTMIWAQNPILLDGNSQPQPDLAILKLRDDFYEEGLPTPSDILLIIEVSDSTTSYDRDIKMPLYAAAGIPEMWLFDINKKAIEGYSLPSSSGYKQMRRYEENDTLAMLAFPDVIFNWEELF
jgi:Uma2 family endonuclease